MQSIWRLMYNLFIVRKTKNSPEDSFSVAKATLHPPMSVCPSVCQSVNKTPKQHKIIHFTLPQHSPPITPSHTTSHTPSHTTSQHKHHNTTSKNNIKTQHHNTTSQQNITTQHHNATSEHIIFINSGSEPHSGQKVEMRNTWLSFFRIFLV